MSSPQRSPSPWGSLEDHFSMKKFIVPHKDATSDVLEEWRKATFSLNATRRFRNVADLKKKREAEEAKKQQQQQHQLPRKLRGWSKIIAVSALSPNANKKGKNNGSKKSGFDIDGAELAHLVGDQDMDALYEQQGVNGIAEKLHTSADKGLCSDQLKQMEDTFGANKYTETPPKGFWVFVWEAMHDLTLIILAICAIVSLGIGIVTEGWKEGWYDGAGIAFSIVLVVFVTSASDYKQSLQFRELENEKKKIFVEVVRDKHRQKISIFDLLVGDVVHLKIGDQVPADGLYICGSSLTIDESSMTGESETKIKDENNDPFLLSGTKVLDGNGKMLVTGVGMNTEWGNLMATLGEAVDDETPLQVKLNGVATLIGKIGLAFAVITFLVLLGRFLYTKESLGNWSAEDAVIIVDYFAIAVTIIVVAVPEGLPLAVTLTLAFAMKQMMADKALVRHLSACETMGSATTICSDKTGTLTSNKMMVVKAWAAGAVREIGNMKQDLPDELLRTLLRGAFLNCDGDVSENDDGSPPSFLGSPTETAILEFGMKLGGKFKAVCSKCEKVKVEPFNSTRKRMGVVEKKENGELIAHWKGASEIVLGLCDKTVDANGSIVELDETTLKDLNGVIRSFADQALRTLCLAFREVDRVPGSNEPIPDEGFVLAAIVGIKDPVRPGVKDAVRLCHEAGIKVRMVTGDNLNTAKAIALECGILTEDGEAIEGPEFRKLDSDARKKLIPKLQVMARSAPSDKLILVRDLKETGEVVAATGDGTNDAPALHEADIGLVMGIAGTEVKKKTDSPRRILGGKKKCSICIIFLLRIVMNLHLCCINPFWSSSCCTHKRALSLKPCQTLNPTSPKKGFFLFGWNGVMITGGKRECRCGDFG
jgi:Ca2+-transporting ATPase